MPIKFTKTMSTKFPKFERYISIPLILFFTIPPIFLTAFGGVIGSYVGMTIFMIIGGYSMFEVFKNMKMSKYTAIYLGSTILILFFMPWTKWEQANIFFGTKEIAETFDLNKQSLGSLFSTLFSWKILVIYLVSSLIPFTLDPKLKSRNDILQNMIIVVVVSFVIGFFAKGIWIINKFEWTWVFFFVSIAIIADSFGFFGGMFFGKKLFKGAKFAPKLSPKKTWAGFLIGYIFSALFIALAGWYMHIFENTVSEVAFLVLATILIPFVSPFGDLFFSGIKRYLNIKDFSNLLPGHGGAVDRIDAMATVLFVFIILFIAL